VDFQPGPTSQPKKQEQKRKKNPKKKKNCYRFHILDLVESGFGTYGFVRMPFLSQRKNALGNNPKRRRQEAYHA